MYKEIIDLSRTVVNTYLREPRWLPMGQQAARQCMSERMKGKCVDMWGGSVFVSEGELYSKGLLGTGRLAPHDQEASTAAETSPGAAGSTAEAMPS